MTADDSMSRLFIGIRNSLDDYLTQTLQQAVDEAIITDDQRNRIIALSKRDLTGR
jgi:hypothetical protein